MTTDITTFHATAVADPNELKRAMAANAAAQPQKAPGLPFLKLSQDGGIWLYGQENIDVEEGSHWVIDPNQFSLGWVCWSDPKVTGKKTEKLGEVMSNFRNPPEMPPTDHSASGGSWVRQIGMQFRCMNGEDAGVEVMYTANSQGGRDAYGDMYNAVSERLSATAEYFYPVVTLGESHYDSKFGKRVYKPKLDIVGWANAAGELAPSGQLEAPEADAAQAEAAPEAVEEAPKRRRRRTAA